MPTKTILAVLIVSVMVAWEPSVAAEKGDVPGRPDFVASRDFSWKSLSEPENLFWPAYFWYWNGPPTPDVLREQLADMAEHDAPNVCVVPMPHEFRPVTMNTSMDVDYLSPEFFQRVKVAVDEAARRGMHYWIYDEGGWPSGQAAGRVVQTRPDVAVRVLRCNADGKWTPEIVGNWPPGEMGVADLLNPESTRTFISLTHQRYAAAVGSHFGKAIKLTFTDEPKYQAAVPGRVVPWPIGAEDVFRRWFGYDAMEALDAFRVTKMQDLTTAQKKARVDLFDFWSRQFRDAYFLELRDWARQHGLASGGHLDNENDTFAPVSRGFGSVMRPLRAMDVPGVDVIWRQLWLGKENHHFPKFASSAAHQNGTALALTESFGVYGNGLTPAQMKWLVDYQYVRGLTLLVCGVYPLSTRDHLMLGERPHFGRVNPLWDFLPDFHRYVARLGYLLSCGKPAIEIGLYYPVRDLWASADPADAALHDALARALLRRQCDFDIVDDDVLSAQPARVEDGALMVGAMGYRTIVVGPAKWMPQVVQDRLKALEAAGGQVIRIDDPGQIDAALAKIAPTIRCEPPSPDLRVLVRRWPGGGAAFLFNEGHDAYSGAASLTLDGNLHEVEPATGVTRLVRIARSSDGRVTIPLALAAGESMLLVSSSQTPQAGEAPPAARTVVQSVELADGWTARVDRQYAVGEHDYEVRPWDKAEFKPVSLGPWATTLNLGEDFSGHVTYRRTVKVPEALRGGRLVLDLGHVEYAARVRVDGQNVGCVLWNPWRLELPSLAGRSEFELEITVANTLANELTSQRVRDAWSNRKGPGWPGPYHQRELAFEAESRGGGLLGPVRLQLATP
ncbi:MAG: glycosyl hydrolase [Thermoguttaceae bacterium]|nr:glycosyl hydrolase [Thermoguttaceae bacterium]